MNKSYEETDINQSYFLIQKNIGSNWTDRGKYTSKEEALAELDKKIEDDMRQNNIFIYRLLKIDELKLIKSKEKKPDNMLDVF